MKITIEIPDAELKQLLAEVLGKNGAQVASPAVVESEPEHNGKDLDKSVFNMGFSRRALNTLLAYDIRQAWQLAHFTLEMIASARNCGQKTITEIADIANSYGIKFGTKPPLFIQDGIWVIESHHGQTVMTFQTPDTAERFARAHNEEIAK